MEKYLMSRFKNHILERLTKSAILHTKNLELQVKDNRKEYIGIISFNKISTEGDKVIREKVSIGTKNREDNFLFQIHPISYSSIRKCFISTSTRFFSLIL